MGPKVLVELSFMKELCHTIKRDKNYFTGKLKSKFSKNEREANTFEKVDDVKRLLLSAKRKKKTENKRQKKPKLEKNTSKNTAQKKFESPSESSSESSGSTGGTSESETESASDVSDNDRGPDEPSDHAGNSQRDLHES